MRPAQNSLGGFCVIIRTGNVMTETSREVLSYIKHWWALENVFTDFDTWTSKL